MRSVLAQVSLGRRAGSFVSLEFRLEAVLDGFDQP